MLDQALLRRSAMRRSATGDPELAGAGIPAVLLEAGRTAPAPPAAEAADLLTISAESRWRDGGGGAEAKALSRAFQRDARRYDGGFRLY